MEAETVVSLDSQLMSRMKRKSVIYLELLPAQIIRTELSDIDLAVISKLPELLNISKSLRNIRRKDVPSNPTLLEGFVDTPD